MEYSSPPPPPMPPPGAQTAPGPPAGKAQGQPPLAIAAFVCGLIGLFTTWCLFGIPLAILGIVFGVMGRNHARERGAGPGMALAGLILGIVGIVIFAVLLAIGSTQNG